MQIKEYNGLWELPKIEKHGWRKQNFDLKSIVTCPKTPLGCDENIKMARLPTPQNQNQFQLGEPLGPKLNLINKLLDIYRQITYNINFEVLSASKRR